MDKKPTFMCIGPEKTGTSWLYENLKAHPQVYLPPIKEIRYFWETARLPDQDITERLTNNHWHNALYRNHLKKRVDFYQDNQDKLANKNPELIKQLIWDFKYLLLPHNDEWYFSLFADSNEKVSGDITPLYYQLNDQEIQHIRNILPDLKIIILLRNPIDRAWSKAKMNLCQHQGKKLKDVSKEQFYNNFAQEYEQLPSYISLIKKWKKYFPEQNIYIGYYDKLVTQPSQLFDEICNFLSINPNLFPADKRDNLSARVNKGVNINIPHEYFIHLSKMYSKCIEELVLDEGYKPYSELWLNTMNNLSVTSN